MALKKGRRVPNVIAEPMDVDTNNLDDVHNTVIDAKPLAMAVEPMQLESTPENSVARSMSASTLVTLTLTQIQLPSAIPLLPFQISFRIGLAHVFALQLLRIVAGLLFFKLFQAVSEVLPYWNGMETAMRFHVPAVDEPVLDVTVELEGFGNYRLISRNTKPNVDFSKLVAWCVDMIRQIPQVWLCRLKVSPEQR